MVEVCQAARRVVKGLCAFVVEGQTRSYRYSCSPMLLIADLHRAGFHLRKPPIYQRVGIPGSGGPDWLRNDYEPIICFTRGGKLPWSDNTAMGHPPKWAPGGEMSHRLSTGQRVNQWGMRVRKDGSLTANERSVDGERIERTKKPSHHFVKTGAVCGHKNGDTAQDGIYEPPAIANHGNVISVAVGGGVMGNRLCHENEAPFPESLVEFFVRSFCPPGRIVLDCFSGSGTTGAVAVRFEGCDIRGSQVELSRRRIAGVTPTMFPEG